MTSKFYDRFSTNPLYIVMKHMTTLRGHAGKGWRFDCGLFTGVWKYLPIIRYLLACLHNIIIKLGVRVFAGSGKSGVITAC